MSITAAKVRAPLMRLRGPGGPWGRAIQCLLPMSPRSRWKTPGIGARLPT
jgi:hypothetical protein